MSIESAGKSQANHQSNTEQKLSLLARQFEKLLDSCSPELSGRQRILTERRGGIVFMQIITSFKATLDNEAQQR